MILLYDSGVLATEQTILPESSSATSDYVLNGIPWNTLGTGTLRLKITADLKFVSGENHFDVLLGDPGYFDINDSPYQPPTGMKNGTAITTSYATFVLIDQASSNAYIDLPGTGNPQSLYFHAPRTSGGGFAGSTYKIKNIRVTVEGDAPAPPPSVGGGGKKGLYEKWLPGQGPEWLLGVNGQALKAALGSELDYQEWRLLQGLLAPFPTKGSVDGAGAYGLPSDDALDQIGVDRKLRRGPAESSSAYAARLLDAWTAWTFAGSHYGVLRNLQIAGYADMKVVQQNGRYAYLSGTAGTLADLTFGTLMPCTTRAGRPGWSFDWHDDFYSQFGLLFTTDHANLSTASGQAILSEIVREWKPAKALYVGAVVITAGVVWGWPTTMKWGDAGLTWGGNTTRVIDP